MPPQITFITLDNRLTLPVKIFVNRNTNLSSSDISINSKSLIKLNNNYFHIKLSNNYLNNLFNNQLNDKIVEVLFAKPLPQIISPSANFITISNTVGTTKYKLIIPTNLCLTIRYHLNLITPQDYTFLRLIHGDFEEKLLKSDYQLNLLVNKNLFVKSEPSILQEDDGDSSIDEKKLVNMNLKRLHLLNNIQHCMKLYLINHWLIWQVIWVIESLSLVKLLEISLSFLPVGKSKLANDADP